MSRGWRIAPLLVAGMVWGGFLMGDDKKESPIVIPKLPTYYTKLGLSAKQKNDVLRISVKYQAQIQELQQKINELKDQQKMESEKVLTKAQVARLKELLGTANRRKGVEDEDAPVTVDKKKGTGAKDKNAPSEIKK